MIKLTLNSWLIANVCPEKALKKEKRVGQTIFLEEIDENVDMTVEIEDVPDTVTVIRPQEVGSLSVLNSQGGWTQGCDYLLLGHTEGLYYAIFVELKKTVKLRVDTDQELSTPQKEMREQLRWSQPLFHYILSVFRLDNGSTLSESEFEVVFCVFGQEPYGHENKQRIRRNRASLFGDEIYNGMRIRTSYVTVISFSELLTKGTGDSTASQK